MQFAVPFTCLPSNMYPRGSNHCTFLTLPYSFASIVTPSFSQQGAGQTTRHLAAGTGTIPLGVATGHPTSSGVLAH